MTGALSGERSPNLYTPAFLFVPDPHIWVGIRQLPVGPKCGLVWTQHVHIWRQGPDVSDERSVHDPARFGTNQHSPSLYHTATLCASAFARGFFRDGNCRLDTSRAMPGPPTFSAAMRIVRRKLVHERDVCGINQPLLG